MRLHVCRIKLLRTEQNTVIIVKRMCNTSFLAVYTNNKNNGRVIMKENRNPLTKTKGAKDVSDTLHLG